MSQSEPGFRVRYIFLSLSEHLGVLLAWAREGHPGMNKTQPVPVLGSLPAWSGGPCDKCY